MKKTKLKTKKSLTSRFRVTKTGKVLFRGSHVRHLRRHKSAAQLRKQKVPHKVVGALAKKIKKVVPVKP